MSRPTADPGRCGVTSSWSGAVLCGGASRRMGRDKSLVHVDGRPLAVRSAEVLRRAGASAVAAIGGDAAALGALGLEPVPDEHPGEGPLGGILTAVHWSPAPVVVVIAVDLPDLDPETVRAVVSALGESDAAVAHGGRDEPLCAAWRCSRVEVALSAAFGSGERAVHRGWAGLDVVRVRVDSARMTNVNMPSDLVGR